MTSVEPKKIPEGYKQTEVGVIPEDWNIAPLIEICNFGGGTTPPRAQHERYFINGSNNWVKTTDLNNSLIGDSEEQITDLAINETGLKLHPIGTVLVAMYGGFNQIGRTGYLTRPSAINQALVAIKPKPKKLESYYLLSQLNYNVGYWKGVASSSRKDPNITSNDVKNYLLAFPSLKEQTAIANALSDVDNLIAALETLIAKKSAIKTAAMQQLLTGKKRLPAFEGKSEGESAGKSEKESEGARGKVTDNTGKTQAAKPSSEIETPSNHNTDAANTNNQQTAPRPGYKQTELGEIPEDWEVGSLDDFVLALETGISVNSVESMDAFGHGKSILKTSCVAGGYFFPTEGKGIIPIDICRAKMNPKKGSIIISRMNTPALVGEIGYVDNDYQDLYLPDRLWQTKFKPSAKLNSRWLAYILSFPSIAKKIKETATGTSDSMKNISKPSLLAISFPCPLPEEQTAIANVLSCMDTELDALQQRLSKTKTIKQGMMQELLTGKTRLV